MPKKTPESDRFWRRVEKTQTCWNWNGALNHGGKGYGRFRGDDGKWYLPHRWAYQQLVGVIPEGLTVDHLCKNTRCVRPDHLEAVSIRENVLRGDGPPALNARKTMCPKGHQLSGDNLQIRASGRRACRACVRVNERERHRRNADRYNASRRKVAALRRAGRS